MQVKELNDRLIVFFHHTILIDNYKHIYNYLSLYDYELIKEEVIRMRRKTTEEYRQQVYNLVGDEFTVLGEYINARTLIKLKHNKCGYIWSVIPNNFLNGKQCPSCAKKTRKRHHTLTTEQFKRRIKKAGLTDIELLEPYKGYHTKIRFKHKKCGTVWAATPASLLTSKYGCPACALEAVRKHHKNH